MTVEALPGIIHVGRNKIAQNHCRNSATGDKATKCRLIYARFHKRWKFWQYLQLLVPAYVLIVQANDLPGPPTTGASQG